MRPFINVVQNFLEGYDRVLLNIIKYIRQIMQDFIPRISKLGIQGALVTRILGGI